jgi:hypothetical protein
MDKIDLALAAVLERRRENSEKLKYVSSKIAEKKAKVRINEDDEILGLLRKIKNDKNQPA